MNKTDFVQRMKVHKGIDYSKLIH